MQKREYYLIFVVLLFAVAFGLAISHFGDKEKSPETPRTQQIIEKRPPKQTTTPPPPVPPTDDDRVSQSAEIIAPPGGVLETEDTTSVDPTEETVGSANIDPQIRTVAGVEVTYDSTARVVTQGSRFASNPFTKNELSIYSNKYSVTIEDIPECGGSIISNVYVIALNEPTAAGHDHVVLTVPHTNLASGIQAMWDSMPKDECDYYKQSIETSIQLQEVIQSYKNVYQIQDLEKIQNVIKQLGINSEE